jgi:hypothetical protein
LDDAAQTWEVVLKKIVLLASTVVFGVAMTGCASDYERYADAVCACTEKKCVDDLARALTDKLKSDPRNAQQIVTSLTDKDREALKRGDDCGSKLQ